MTIARLSVVGAGVSAHLAALLLSRKGYEICLFAPPQRRTKKGHVPRVYAINCVNIQWLQEVDVWSSACMQRYAPFRSISVWEDVQGQLNFDSSLVGRDALGAMVYEEDLLADCQEALSAISGVTIIPEAVVNVDAELGIVHTKKGQYPSDMVIAADGGQSTIKSLLQVPEQVCDYDQSAMVAVVNHEKPHQGILRQRFLEEGPLALLALKDPHQSALVWTMRHQSSHDRMALSADMFSNQLSEASQFALGACQVSSPVGAFPLKARHVEAYKKDRVLFLGDAAHTVHPLAGQGLNFSMEDLREALKVLDHIDQKNRLINDPWHWQAFQRDRFYRNQKRIDRLTRINQLFCSPSLGRVRPLGMTFLQRFSVVKRLLIQEACGL